LVVNWAILGAVEVEGEGEDEGEDEGHTIAYQSHCD
jgi:hypothetical protein|tara:strand:+ start:49 stop:156 length:108 start_codon:yes stop_codon:yes gene_type:complete